VNHPLSPIEQAKVFFFFFLLTLMIPIGAGILLILVTVWGLYRMRSSHDFSYLTTIFIIHKGFAAIATIGLVTFITYLIFYYWHRDWYDYCTEYAVYLILSLFIYPVYSFIFNWLFYTPLNNRKEWVIANGIFTTTEAKVNEPRTTPLISLPTFSIKGSSSLSVADELIKLNDLKEKGLVTQDEFNKLRQDLLR
jgi:hypothetical protein